MGKASGVEEEQAVLPASDESGEQNVERSCSCCCRRGFNGIHRVIGVRCVLVLTLSLALFLSAVFWLPPFLQFPDQGDLDLDSKVRDHGIVASFKVMKPVSLLEDNIFKLEDDIFAEMNFFHIKVVILSLEPSTESNITNVVFGVDPNPKHSKVPSTVQSLIKALFEPLVVNQSSLRLTQSLFGDPFSFEVLKFPGGITIIPQQNAFLLQTTQILFNFTLNFSIYQIRMKFAELGSQLKAGLRLTSDENLYICLYNSKGSTVAPPTTVQSSVFLAVGNANSRLRQLAQTIRGHSRNLGLNNTVFGRVKQVRLSSIHNGGEGSSTSPSPSPTPLPHPSHQHQHQHHRRHHHHHHYHHHSAHLAPAIVPVPAPSTERGAPAPVLGSPAPLKISPTPLKRSPAPQNSKEAEPPGCQLGRRGSINGRNQSHLAPTAAPKVSPHFYAASPQPHIHPPAVSPTPAQISHTVPASSPLPAVVFAHVQPPTNGELNEHSDARPSISPSPLPSSAGLLTARRAFSLSLVLLLHI